MTRLRVFSSAVFALILSGCAVPEPAPRAPHLDLPPVSTRAYAGPTPTIAIHQTGEAADFGRAVEVTLTVPSGGHRLVLDHGDVVDGEALIFITIEQPAPDEAVTTAIETLRAEFKTDRVFEAAKVHVRSHRRGETPPVEYRFAGDRRVVE